MTKQQVPELDQAMERCVYGESIAADLLNGTGEANLRRWKPQKVVLVMNGMFRQRIDGANAGGSVYVCFSWSRVALTRGMSGAMRITERVPVATCALEVRSGLSPAFRSAHLCTPVKTLKLVTIEPRRMASARSCASTHPYSNTPGAPLPYLHTKYQYRETKASISEKTAHKLVLAIPRASTNH